MLSEVGNVDIDDKRAIGIGGVQASAADVQRVSIQVNNELGVVRKINDVGVAIITHDGKVVCCSTIIG